MTTDTNSSSDFRNLEKYRVRIPRGAYRPLDQPAQDPEPGKDGFFYIPEFISEDEEKYLIDKINTAPMPKWKALANRRLQYWGGQVSSKNTLIPEPLPDWMTRFPPLVQRIASTGAFAQSAHAAPNHCLVNEYHPGQGIMPHEDGAAYFPAVATVSLGSYTLLDIYRWADEEGDDPRRQEAQPQQSGQAVGEDTDKDRDAGKAGETGKSKVRAREQDPIFSLLQEPRSLLITVGSAYRDFLHGIAPRHTDEAPSHSSNSSNDTGSTTGTSTSMNAGSDHLTRIANVHSLRSATYRDVVLGAMRAPGGNESKEGASPTPTPRVLSRETRLSLTFRDVEKVHRGLGIGLVRR